MAEGKELRNRSQGWAHAKKSGHQNERNFGELLKGDAGFLRLLEGKKFPDESTKTPSIIVDGSKKVPSIFGDETTSKVDLELRWGDERVIGVSIKKSSGGQVWLVSVDRFVRSVEHYIGSELTTEVKLALSLFIGGSTLESHKDSFSRALEKDKERRPRIHAQETRQMRLVADSIKEHFPGVFEHLIQFLSENIELVTDLAFSRGLANSPRDWADIVVYNLAPGHEKVFGTGELSANAKRRLASAPIEAGPRNGGSTILLPTGFMQMHHPQGQNLLQIHHAYPKVLQTFNEPSPT